MTDLKTLALQTDPIQGEITEILSPELSAHVQKLIDAAVMKEREERDRLRSALKGFYDNSTKADWADDIYDNASKALAGEELNKKYVGGVLD